jgi:cell fate regulator YaaT (PSP1 superfamily)
MVDEFFEDYLFAPSIKERFKDILSEYGREQREICRSRIIHGVDKGRVRNAPEPNIEIK